MEAGRPLGLFPIFRKRTPILDRLRGQKVGVEPSGLTEAQRRLGEEFRRGIAEALGVPPEAIREEPLERWIIAWTKAFVKPEYYAQGRALGRELGQILREVSGR
jgi:hypothetical protein